MALYAPLPDSIVPDKTAILTETDLSWLKNHEPRPIYSGAMRSLKQRICKPLKRTNYTHRGPANLLDVDRMQCAYCFEKFKSRNALFYHLRIKGVDTSNPTHKVEKRRRQERYNIDRLTKYLRKLKVTADPGSESEMALDEPETEAAEIQVD